MVSQQLNKCTNVPQRQFRNQDTRKPVKRSTFKFLPMIKSEHAK